MNKSTTYPCPKCKNMIVKKSKCKRDFLRGTCHCIVLGHQILVIDQRGCYCSQSLLSRFIYLLKPTHQFHCSWLVFKYQLCSSSKLKHKRLLLFSFAASFIEFSYLSYCNWYLVFLVLGLCIEPITLLLTRMLLYDSQILFSKFISSFAFCERINTGTVAHENFCESCKLATCKP